MGSLFKLNRDHRIVLLASLGYFVDIFDLMLFSIFRTPSLKDIGLEGEALISASIRIMNFQMGGLLLGGFFWGILADRIGRVKTLFGSIFLYSIMTLLNSYAQTPEQYAWLRFFAGLGLAGELGTGVTLICETLTPLKRGIGTFIMAGCGLSGAIFASLSADFLSWRAGYLLGGALGIGLLLLRISTFESSLFQSLSKTPRNQTQELFRLFSNPRRVLLFLRLVGTGVPIWFIGGIIILLSPELASLMKITDPIKGNHAVMMSYIGVVIGDVLSGGLSQIVRSRKKPIFIFMALTCLGFLLTLCLHLFVIPSSTLFYGLLLFTGVGTGYWVLCMTIASESFGTNVRATVTTALPNLVRGSVIVINLLVTAFRSNLGLLNAALLTGAICFAIGFGCLVSIRDTWGKPLDFVE